MRTARQILDAALELSEEERATVALELLESLAPLPTLTEEQWISEVERRARRALRGEAASDSTLDDALDQVDRELGL